MQNRQIFESLNLNPDSKLAAIVAHNALPSILGMPSPFGNVDGAVAASRIGGLPDLASDYPRDRAGRPLLFLAQINFADLSGTGCANILPAAQRHEAVPSDDSLGCHSFGIAKSGLLSIFWNERKDGSNPKDRHSFRIIWSDASQVRPSNTDPSINSICDPIPLSLTNHWSVPANISDWKISSDGSTGLQPASNDDPNSRIDTTQIQKIIDHNTSSLSNAICVLFGYGDAEINRKKEIAAFASNGVSWSPARSADSCYNHLVDAARDWIFLLRIKSMPELGFDLGGTKSISLLIHKNDLTESHLDKACLVY